ncbi:Domain of uncharacterised function (DUF2825) [Serratia entomophila]|nr:Domain of uncharacterised function (DUF2825) [Serratia entomophila]CAI1800550.1 Domain of uncharacterised function (DUF2825) [Serratia entomophila]CAI1836756.1 Domain of uncharacterised function (DUF2825) [Serratia entomophila]CAI1860985.1 Domain of uncharacterised function (DUF2825) [Serratia entomophila]
MPDSGADRPTPVYPRSRGEHHHDELVELDAIGLSPLSRGTPCPCPFTSITTRFIPALAGNTDRPGSDRTAISVYPRSRGEHLQADRIFYGADGLSPLSRGTLTNSNCWRTDERFIPALAGNTVVNTNPTKRAIGLSPLSRGTLPSCSCASGWLRFIPALAGNTFSSALAIIFSPVYPRSRGEHIGVMRECARHCGLSPLSRGTLYIYLNE